jgi:hypothetical protein
MTQLTTSTPDVTRLYSPIGLRLIDELTNQGPIGSVTAFLDKLGASGTWLQTDVQGVVTPSATVSYPSLERRVSVAGVPAQTYRVRLTADYYIPYYLTNADGIQFQAYPYNDDNPPAVITKMPVDTLLLPGASYPFATHIPVLRGEVVDAAGNPVPNAYVSQSNTERTLTDARGTFALPLRWVQANTPVPIDATDQRTGRSGSISVQIPAALSSNQRILIS